MRSKESSGNYAERREARPGPGAIQPKCTEVKGSGGEGAEWVACMHSVVKAKQRTSPLARSQARMMDSSDRPCCCWIALCWTHTHYTHLSHTRTDNAEHRHQEDKEEEVVKALVVWPWWFAFVVGGQDLTSPSSSITTTTLPLQTAPKS